MCHILLIRSCVGGHLDCFHLLAAVNMSVQVPRRGPAFCFGGIYLEVKLLGHRVILFSNFHGTAIWFSTAVIPFYVPTHKGSGLSTSLPTLAFCFCFVCLFYCSHLSGYDVVSRCCFDLHVPND